MASVRNAVCALAVMPAFGVAFLAPGPGLLPSGGLGINRIASNAGLRAPALPIVPATAARSGQAGLRCAKGSLETWLEENGGRTVCTVTPTGLVAQRDLKAGEEACSISQKACLTRDSAKAAFGEIAETVDAETAIALQLLLEKSKGASSAWAPWVATLPDRDALEMPYFWPTEDQQLLEGTSVRNSKLEWTHSFDSRLLSLQQTAAACETGCRASE